MTEAFKIPISFPEGSDYPDQPTLLHPDGWKFIDAILRDHPRVTVLGEEDVATLDGGVEVDLYHAAREDRVDVYTGAQVTMCLRPGEVAVIDVDQTHWLVGHRFPDHQGA